MRRSEVIPYKTYGDTEAVLWVDTKIKSRITLVYKRELICIQWKGATPVEVGITCQNELRTVEIEKMRIYDSCKWIQYYKHGVNFLYNDIGYDSDKVSRLLFWNPITCWAYVQSRLKGPGRMYSSISNRDCRIVWKEAIK